MGKGRLRRPSPALVVAVVALFVAMGGTGYAAFKLPKSSVGTKQIKKNAVTGAKVKSGTLGLSDLAASARNSLKGQTGPAGQNGAAGARGPSDVFHATGSTACGGNCTANSTHQIVSLDLPAGSYVIHGKAVLQGITSPGSDSASVCKLLDGTNTDESYQRVHSSIIDASTLTPVLVVTYSAPTTVHLDCNVVAFGWGALESDITAIQVGTIH